MPIEFLEETQSRSHCCLKTLMVASKQKSLEVAALQNQKRRLHIAGLLLTHRHFSETVQPKSHLFFFQRPSTRVFLLDSCPKPPVPALLRHLIALLGARCLSKNSTTKNETPSFSFLRPLLHVHKRGRLSFESVHSFSTIFSFRHNPAYCN